MLEEYSDWFSDSVAARFGGASCLKIAGEGEPDLQVCGGILAQAMQRIRDILIENGLELEQPRHA
jgi:hypothetical protein